MAKEIGTSDTTVNFGGPQGKQLLQAFYGPTGAIPQLTAAEANLPSLTQLGTGAPLLNVPDLTPDQLAQIQAIQAQGSASPELAAAFQQLQQLTAGPIGSSPATQAGMEAFRQLTAPSIEQQQALMGRANSGAAIEAQQQGATAAAVPLIQQEIQTRDQAVNQYGQLQQQQIASLSAALEAAGMPREVAQQQAQAAYQKLAQQYGFATELQTLPLSTLGQLLGSSTRTTGHTTKGAMDYIGGAIGGIGDSLSALGS